MKIKSISTIRGNFKLQKIYAQSYQTIKLNDGQIILRNPKLSDMPDIDFDCANNETVKASIIALWGEDCVASITNWNTLQLSSLLKDISKFYGIPYKDVNNLTNVMLREAVPKIKEELGIKAGILPSPPTFEQVLKYSTSLQDFISKHPEIKDHIHNLFRQVKSAGRHAGGIVVGEDLPSHMPLIYSGGVRQTPWSEGQNVRHLEPLGFIKFDILGIGTLRMIEDAIRLILKKKNGKNPSFEEIKAFYNQNLHPNILNFDDQAVYKNIFHNGNFIGVFQFAEEPMQKFTISAKPKSLIDLSVLTSIYRPGPLSANVHHDYLIAKEDPSSIKYIHSIVKDVLGNSYGFLIFQEQISLLANLLGRDISLDDANLLRKVLTKKGTGKEVEVKNRLHDKFVDGCIEKDIRKEDAENLWQTFIYFSGYGFNKSHAVCYSIISFQCAWMLHYYPTEWICAYLNEQEEDKRAIAIGVAKSMGFDIQDVDINLSSEKWEPYPGNDRILVQPLSSLKGLGEKAIEQIASNRPFLSIEDLMFNSNIKYNKLNKKGLDVLIRSGACKSLQDQRFKNMNHFWHCTIVEKPKNKEQLEQNIIGFAPVPEFSKEEIIENLVSLTGIFPLETLVPIRLINQLQQKGVPPINEYDSELEICWFVPTGIEVRQTKKGKEYWVLNVIDNLSKSVRIKIWSPKKEDRIFMNRPYVSKLKYDDQWGFSSFGTKGMKLIG